MVHAHGRRARGRRRARFALAARPFTAARANRLERGFACPVCEGQAVFNSNSSQSQAIRPNIPRRIAAGQSDADIHAYYVSKYGEQILETPSNSGLGVVA